MGVAVKGKEDHTQSHQSPAVGSSRSGSTQWVGMYLHYPTPEPPELTGCWPYSVAKVSWLQTSDQSAEGKLLTQRAMVKLSSPLLTQSHRPETPAIAGLTSLLPLALEAQKVLED